MRNLFPFAVPGYLRPGGKRMPAFTARSGRPWLSIALPLFSVALATCSNTRLALAATIRPNVHVLGDGVSALAVCPLGAVSIHPAWALGFVPVFATHVGEGSQTPALSAPAREAMSYSHHDRVFWRPLVPVATVGPPSGLPSVVLALRDGLEVRRIETRAIRLTRTAMIDMHSLRYRSDDQSVGKPMDFPLLAFEVGGAVAVNAGTLPNPASVGLRRLEYRDAFSEVLPPFPHGRNIQSGRMFRKCSLMSKLEWPVPLARR